MRNIILIVVVGLLASCSQKSLMPVEYVAYFENEENGLRVKKTRDDFELILQFKTKEYVALMQSKNAGITKAELEEQMDGLQDLQYFTLRIVDLKQQQKANAGADEFMQYLSFKIQNDLSLKEGERILPCVMHHYVPGYGLAPHYDIVIAFEKTSDDNTDKTLIWNDNISGKGKIEIKIHKKDLATIPALKLT